MQIKKGRGLRTEPWDPPKFRGQGGEEDPAKETEEECPVRAEESQERVTFWKVSEEVSQEGRRADSLNKIRMGK